MTDDVVAHGMRHERRSAKSGFFHFCPLFAYLLVLYIVVKFAGFDVRAILFTVGTYPLTWVEVLYVLAAISGMLEMWKVSEPKVDNTIEALWILGAWILYFALFILGAAGVKIWFVGFSIFNNTEFLVLTAISAFQVVSAFVINSRTLQLQIADTR